MGCPIKCQMDEIQCAGNKNENGCPQHDTCHPRESKESKQKLIVHKEMCHDSCHVIIGPFVDIHGNKCPSPTCGPSCDLSKELDCPGGKDSMGCPTNGYCLDKHSGKHCHATSMNTITFMSLLFGTGGMDNNGNPCPIFCENRDCGPDMTYCEKGMNSMGCRDMGYCMNTKSKFSKQLHWYC